ncbi:hypothetical protein ABVK25_005232 [Lepraria finkii]|uniref:Uncharacterized protein n=1 Tax=Lepraria finkii TaxID=1340010 RepID=A0ABR4BCF4_9LECA
MGRRESVMPDQPPRAATTIAAFDDPYPSYYPPAVRNRDVPVEQEHGYVLPRPGDYSYGPSWPPSDQPTLDPTGRSYGDRYFTNTSAPSPSYTSYDYGSAAIPSPFSVAQSRYAPGGPYPEPEQPSPAPYNRGYGDDRNPALGGDGIHREVLQREICKYLGPEASSRPSLYNGIQGYVIKAVRPFTPMMLDDLQELSGAYIAEIREVTRRGHQGINYEESETSRRKDAILTQITNDRNKSSPTAYSTLESQSGYPPRPAYPMAPSPPSYVPQAIYATPPAHNYSYSTPSWQSKYPAGSTSGYPQSPGYGAVDTSRERAPYRYGYSSYGDPNEAVRNPRASASPQRHSQRPILR